jgi:thiamine-phosphate pyrophosphorylase
VEIKKPVVCLVTDGRGDAAAALLRIEAAARAGVDLVQLREPRLADRALVELTARACDAVRGSGTRIIVNDRLDVAMSVGAHGVHLRGNSFDAARVRATAGAAFLIGRSVHTLAEAVATDRERACDYLVFGTVFPSPSKPEGHAIAGLDALRDVCRRVTVPVLAIGGITRDRMPGVIAAGAAGIAAITLFEDADSLQSTMDFVRRSFDT